MNCLILTATPRGGTAASIRHHASALPAISEFASSIIQSRRQYTSTSVTESSTLGNAGGQNGENNSGGGTVGKVNGEQQPSKKNATGTKTRKFNTINTDTPYQLCFLRHGQSTWNRDNVFIGWTDTPLTEDGVLEARVAGQMLAASNMKFDEVHTSLLRRSIRTTNMCLMELGQEYIPVYKNWRLNERSYGQLVGRNKKEVVKQYGSDQVKRWRRSYDEPPPPMNATHEHWPGHDPRYRFMINQIPKSESLKDTMLRSSVYWEKVIAPSLKLGKTILVVGHENNLRSLIMRLEDIPKEDIINLSLPRAVPLAYRLDENLKPLDRPDGKLDEATGFLRGEWLGGDESVRAILERDHKQVYDTSISANLETGSSWHSWRAWMESAIGSPTPEMKAASLPGKKTPNGGGTANGGEPMTKARIF